MNTRKKAGLSIFVLFCAIVMFFFIRFLPYNIGVKLNFGTILIIAILLITVAALTYQATKLNAKN